MPSSTALRPDLLARSALVAMLFWLSRAWLNLGDAQETGNDAPGQASVYIIIQIFLLFYIFKRMKVSTIQMVAMRDVYFTVFFLTVLSLLPLSSVPMNSLGVARAILIIYLASFAIASDLNKKDILNIFFETVGVIMLLALFVSIAFPFGRADGAHLGAWRGLFSHKNGLGEVSAFAVILFCAVYFTRNRVPLRFYLYAAASTICLGMSFSVTGLTAAAGGTIALAIALLLSKRRMPPSIKVAIYLCATIIFGYFIASNYEDILALLGRDTTFTGRDRIWASFLYWADRSPMFGWGLASTSQNEIILGAVQSETHLLFINTPHSMYILQAVELGYPLAIAFTFWLMLRFLRSLYSAFSNGNSASFLSVGVIAGCMILGSFEATVGLTNCIWFGCICLLSIDPYTSTTTTGVTQQSRWIGVHNSVHERAPPHVLGPVDE